MEMRTARTAEPWPSTGAAVSGSGGVGVNNGNNSPVPGGRGCGGSAGSSRGSVERRELTSGERPRVGAHSLMARRTFSLFTGDRCRLADATHEQPPSARNTPRRPPLLPSSAVPSVVRTPSLPAATAPRLSVVSSNSPREERTPAAVPAEQQQAGHLRPPSGRGRFIDTLDVPRRGPARSILRSGSSESNSPSGLPSKHVSFAGDCKAPPPSSITDLLSLVRGSDDSQSPDDASGRYTAALHAAPRGERTGGRGSHFYAAKDGPCGRRGSGSSDGSAAGPTAAGTAAAAPAAMGAAAPYAASGAGTYLPGTRSMAAASTAGGPGAGEAVPKAMLLVRCGAC